MDLVTAFAVLDTPRDILPPLELSWSLLRDIIRTASESPRNTQKLLHIVSRGIEILKALRIPFSEPPISLGQFMNAMESLRKLERLLIETKEIVEKEAKIPLKYSDKSKKTWGMRRDALLKLLNEAHAPEFEPPEGWKDEVDEVTRVDDHRWVSLIAHDMWNFGDDLQAAQDAEHVSATLLEQEGEEASSAKRDIEDIMTTWEEVRRGAQSSPPLLQRLGSFMKLSSSRLRSRRRSNRSITPRLNSNRPDQARRGSNRPTQARRGPGKSASSRLSSTRHPGSGQGSSKRSGSGQSANKPAASTQGSNKPATSRPGSNSPARVNQSPNKPASSAQGSNKPAASAQATNRPAASTQGTNRSAASTQGTNKPAASTQAPNKPAASTQGTNKPAPSTSGSLFQVAFNRFAPKDVQLGDVTLSSDPKKGVKVGLSPDEEDSSAQPSKSGAAKAATAEYRLSSNPGDQEVIAEDTGDEPQDDGDGEDAVDEAAQAQSNSRPQA